DRSWLWGRVVMARTKRVRAWLLSLFTIWFVFGANLASAQGSTEDGGFSFARSLAEPDPDQGIIALGIAAGAIFMNPDVKASTTVGTDDRSSVNHTQGVAALDVRARLGGFGDVHWIWGGRAGTAAGSDWDTSMNLDPFIAGPDTDISGSQGAFGAIYGGVETDLWQGPNAQRISASFKGGGGLIGYEIDGRTLFGGRAGTGFSEDETLGYWFAEAETTYQLPALGPDPRAHATISLGVSVQGLEDFDFTVPGRFGDAKIEIDNNTDVAVTGRVSLPFYIGRFRVHPY
ncbi:MAG: hypothetical protein AAF405_05695, partial [Pseudomonadota bacterium]